MHGNQQPADQTFAKGAPNTVLPNRNRMTKPFPKGPQLHSDS